MPGSTAKIKLPYPLPTDQVSAGANDIRALAEAVEASAATGTVAVLPAAPYVGQRVHYSPGEPSGASIWELYWNGSIWMFVGGSPVHGADLSRVAATNAYNVLGPSVNLPLIGVYDLLYGARWDSNNDSAGAGWLAPSGAGFVPNDAAAQITQTGHPYGGWTPFQGSGLFGVRSTTLWGTIGGTVSLAYRNDSGAPAYASNRVLWARPCYLTGVATAGLSEDELERELRKANVALLAAGVLELPVAPDLMPAALA